jgi:hypothetical protein
LNVGLRLVQKRVHGDCSIDEDQCLAVPRYRFTCIPKFQLINGLFNLSFVQIYKELFRNFVLFIGLLNILVVFYLGVVLILVKPILYFLEKIYHVALCFVFFNVSFRNLDAIKELGVNDEGVRTILTLSGDSTPNLSVFGLTFREECLDDGHSTLVIDSFVFAGKICAPTKIPRHKSDCTLSRRQFDELGCLFKTRRLCDNSDLRSYFLTVDGILEFFERPLIFEDD